MKSKEDQIDKMIREALSQEEAEIFERVFDEPSVFELLTANFRGKRRYLAVLGIVIGVVFTALGVFSLLEFLAADEVPSMLRWGALLFFSLMSVMAMKVWHWMEMQRHALTREIKRLELQVANLASERAA